MSKYISRANELLARVQSCIDKYIEVSYDEWSDTQQLYSELLFDIQTLFFVDAPQSPFCKKATCLETKMCERINNYNAQQSFDAYDFDKLKTLLLKFVEYRTFLEEEE